MLLPYVVWNIIIFLGYYVLDSFQGRCWLIDTSVFSYVVSRGPFFCLKFVLGAPLGYPLWFLRDLIAFVVLAPILFVLISKMGIWLAILYFLLVQFDSFFVGLFFFILGGVVSERYSLEAVDRVLQHKWLRFLSLTLTVGYLFIVPFYHDSIPILFKTLARLSGMVVFWNLYDKTPLMNRISNKSIVGYTFFLYCFHEPFFLEAVKKYSIVLLGESNLSLTVLYLVNPIVSILVIYWLAVSLKCVMPKVYTILSGGR